MPPRKSAQKSEATDTPTEVEYKDEVYTIPPALDVPMEILETENQVEIVRLILGDEQWKKFREGKPTLRDFRDFSELVVEAAGFDDLGK